MKWLLVGIMLYTAGASRAQHTHATPVTGYTWGTDYKECLKQVKQSEGRTQCTKDRSIRYTHDEAETVLVFDEAAELEEIRVVRVFTEGQGEKAMAYFNRVLHEMNEQFGEYDSHRSHTGRVLVFGWERPKNHITLTYSAEGNTVTAQYRRAP